MREREKKKRRGKSLKKLCVRELEKELRKRVGGKEKEKSLRERDLRGTGNTVFREKIE